jgi:hypothetical protein
MSFTLKQTSKTLNKVSFKDALKKEEEKVKKDIFYDDILNIIDDYKYQMEQQYRIMKLNRQFKRIGIHKLRKRLNLICDGDGIHMYNLEIYSHNINNRKVIINVPVYYPYDGKGRDYI